MLSDDQCRKIAHLYNRPSIYVQRYNENLTEAKDFGVKKSFVAGLGSGLVYGILFCSYGLAFWYGSRLVRESIREGNDTYTAGTMMTVS